uniref:Uncharacterized protein n=1 Tax=Arundo donax TaxID=35708 RepID=A0A0A8YQ37_ARUDO
MFIKFSPKLTDSSKIQEASQLNTIPQASKPFQVTQRK